MRQVIQYQAMRSATRSGPSRRQAVRGKRPGKPFTRRVESIDDLVAEKLAPAAVDLVTARTPEKIVPTRWKDHEGRWVYVAEIGEGEFVAATDVENGGSKPYPPLANQLPGLTFLASQIRLDQYATVHGWTPDPPLPVDEDEARPVRKNGTNHKGHEEHEGPPSAPNREEEAYSVAGGKEYTSSSLSRTDGEINDIGRRWKDDRGRWLYVAETSPHVWQPCLVCPMVPALHAPRQALPNGNWPIHETAELAQSYLDSAGARKGWACEPAMPRASSEKASTTAANRKSENSNPNPGLPVIATSKRASKAAGAAKTQDPRPKTQNPAPDDSDRFHHSRHGLVPAAQKWLSGQGVADNLQPLFLTVLSDAEEISISFQVWDALVDALMRPWIKAGWTEVTGGDQEYALAGTTAGIPLGITLDCNSLTLHEAEENDAGFRQAVSSTGFRRLAGIDARRVTPGGLAKHMEAHLAEWREELAHPEKRGETKTPRAARRSKNPKSKIVSTALVPTGVPPGRRDLPGGGKPPAASLEMPMTAVEKRDVKRLETAIRTNLKAARRLSNETSSALEEVRDRRLFRDRYATFEAYCRGEFGFGRQEAGDQIAAAKVAAIVSPIGDKAHVPLTESHLKELAPLVNEPKDVKAIYERVVKRCGKEGTPVTAKLLREERVRYTTPADELEKGRGKPGGSRLPGGTATAAGPDLAEAVRELWLSQLQQVKEHVETVAEKWHFPRCREALIKMLLELAGEFEAGGRHGF